MAITSQGPTQRQARAIVNELGGKGEPPLYGIQYFTAGIDVYLKTLEDEYLAEYVKGGGADFKLVVGVYGGGKTHFLYAVRDLAWKHDFVVSYVSLSQAESPFHSLDKVYRAIVRGIIPPLTPDELLSTYSQGIDAFLRGWTARRLADAQDRGLEEREAKRDVSRLLDMIQGIDSASFKNAMAAAVRSLLDGDEATFEEIMLWLRADGYDASRHKKHGILHRVDQANAKSLVRSIARWVSEVGYSGLVLLLDEAERVTTLSTRQREAHLSNLRELIDECGHPSFQNVMIFYAVPDRNFLEGRTQTYEALKQRVSTVFQTLNPTGVQIILDDNEAIDDPLAFLREVGSRIGRVVYQVAYNHEFDPPALDHTIEMVARFAHEQRFQDAGYKRLFVQTLVKGLHFLRAKGAPPTPEDLN